LKTYHPAFQGPLQRRGSRIHSPPLEGCPTGGVVFIVVIGKVSFGNESPSPDSSGNPFYFFFKNKKIATNSGK